MKKLKKDILDLTAGGVVIGVGSKVTAKAGLADSGLGEVAKFAPVMGTLAGAGAVVRLFGEMKPKKKRRRK